LTFSDGLKKKPILFIVTVVFFYAIILLISDLNKIASQLSEIKLEYYFPIFSLMFIALLMTGWRYQIILKKLDINLKFKDSFTIFVSGLSMLITPGGSGALIKSYLLKKKIGISMSSSTPIIFYEKWLELVSIVILIGILLFWTNYLESLIIFIIGTILAGITFFIFRYSAGLNFLNKLLMKFKFLEKFIINSEEFKKTTATLLKPSSIIQLLSLSLIIKFVIIFTVFLIFQSFNSELDIFSSAQIYFTSTLIGILTLIPGGIIVTETGMLGMLVSNNVDFSSATVLVLMLRFVTTWSPIIFGFVILKRTLGKISSG